MRDLWVIELHDVGRQYQAGMVRALHACSFSLHHGAFLTVTGVSGSGKTTLLNIVGLLDRLDTGRYVFRGLDTSQMSERERCAARARDIGFLFQDSFLLGERTAIDNVALGLRYAAYPRRIRTSMAYETLEGMGLVQRAEAKASSLSAGERQRVALARAIVKRPVLLLCDEPTGNLDSSNSRVVVSMIKHAADSGTCVVVVTHDESIARVSALEIRLRDGLMEKARGISRPHEATTAARPTSRQNLSRTDRLLDFIEDVGTLAGQRISRTVLTGMGALLGVALFAFSTSLSTTAANAVASEFDALAATSIDVVSRRPQAEPLLISPDNLARLQSVPGVVSAGVLEDLGEVEVTLAPGLVRGEIGPLGLAGVSTGTTRSLGFDISGRDMTRTEHLLGLPVAIMGRGLLNAADVNVGEGSVIAINGHQFTVIGILENTRRHGELLLGVVIPSTAADRIRQGPVADRRAIIHSEVGTTGTVAREAVLILNANHPEDLLALYAPEAEQLRLNVTTQIQALDTVLAIGLLVVGASTIGSVTMSSVLERKSEIGLRRALGSSTNDILMLFMGEAVLVGIVASLLGLVLALGAFLVVAVLRGWVPVVPAFIIGLAPVAGAVVGLLGGAAPARMAARLEPVVALRT